MGHIYRPAGIRMIGVAYRPSNGNKLQSLAELNSLMTKLLHSNVYLTGDFNIDLLGNLATELEDTVFVNGFNPLISIATHFKPGCKPSCIDNILTNSTDTLKSSGVLKSNVNHHCPIFCITSSLSIPSLPKYGYNESNMVQFGKKNKTLFNLIIITKIPLLINKVLKLLLTK